MTSTAKPTAVIFDVDGVLVDSYHAHHESWRLLCQERGWEMTAEQFHDTFGRTSREIVRELWSQHLTSADEVAAVDDRKEELYRGILASAFPAMDGAAALISQLRAAGFLLAVGSSGPPANVALTLDGLWCRAAFQAVVTGADVTRGKPDPQVFQLAAQRLGVPPPQCIVIEDAPVGVAAAHAAGMSCVALVSTGRFRHLLLAADLVVDSLRDLSAAALRQVLARYQVLRRTPGNGLPVGRPFRADRDGPEGPSYVTNG